MMSVVKRYHSAPFATSCACEGIRPRRHELQGNGTVEVSAVLQPCLREPAASIARLLQQQRGFERITLAD
jgi:hypothetical protein